MSSLSLATEFEVLGTFIRNPNELAKADLDVTDFSAIPNQIAFAAMRRCLAEGLNMDPVTVAEQTGAAVEDVTKAGVRKWDAEAAGDFGESLAHIAGIWNNTVGSAAALPRRIETLKAASRRRRFGELLATASQQLEDDPNASDAIRGRTMMKLSEFDAPVQKHDHDASAVVATVLEHIERAASAKAAGKLQGIPTGIDTLDAALGGWHNTDLVIVGGRPAMGKTAFLLKAALSAARGGHRVGIVSAEMSATQMGLRLVGMGAGVAPDKIRRAALDEQDYAKLAHVAGKVRDLPVRIFDRPKVTPADVAIQARVWKLCGGLDVLFIDYLQRIQPDRRHDSMDQEIGSVASAFKSLARSLEIPVIVMASVNRECERRDDKRPMMSDLRGSGLIEFEADVALFLYRDAVYNANADPASGEIIIDKNRHGPCRTVPARFDGELMRWRSVADDDACQAPAKAAGRPW